MADSTDVVLSLGSNLGNRRDNLCTGLKHLSKAGCSIQQISPAVESPAQLPPNSPSAWNRPFLNVVVQGKCNLGIEKFYQVSKQIQTDLGKAVENKWQPRNLDIDIVFWGSVVTKLNGKLIPDSTVYSRPYVLSPLVHMAPQWGIPGSANVSALAFSCTSKSEFHIPLWMGILNITPDSFSDGGRFAHLENMHVVVENMISNGVNIIDIGAESTRPNATPLTADEEWTRLKPALKIVKEMIKETVLPPQISVDTYHPATAEKCLELNVDMINDVGGLRSKSMMALARSCDKTFIAMHSVTVPVDSKISLDPAADACAVFENWIREGRELWDVHGLDLHRIIVDPGIGFGKSSLQSLDLMRSTKRFRKLGHRLMVGHSRKRFLRSFSDHASANLDIETIGASLQMCSQSVDILRVHSVEAHTRAYLSWAHLLKNRA